nr:unnamed protein product [Spirometra erinaceieuropaei]
MVLELHDPSCLYYADGHLRDERLGIRIVFRTNGHLLNDRRLQPSTYLSMTTVQGLLFPDACVLKTVSEADVQRSTNPTAAGCANFGLITNTGKTVVMHQPPLNAAYKAPLSHVSTSELKTVEDFACLGSTLSRCIEIGDEEAHWISLPAEPSAGCRN